MKSIASKASSWLVGVSLVLALGLTALPAAATGLGSVDDFDPANVEPEGHGARIGGFTLYPKLKLTGGFDDNVFAADTIEVDDTFVSLQGTAILSSNWSQHMFLLGLSAGTRRYSEQDGLDRDNLTIDGRFVLDVRRSTQVSARARYSQSTEYPGNTNLPATASETANASSLLGELRLRHDFAQFQVVLAGSVEELDFDDVSLVGGGTFDNDVRDHRESKLSARLSVPISPTTAIFAQGTFNRRDYDQSPPAVPINRDSEGYEVVGGVQFEVVEQVHGEVFAGYLEQDYEALTDISGPAFGASLEWAMTRLTSLEVFGERQVRETAAVASPGYLYSAVGAKLEHELLRNLNLRFGAEYSQNDYEGIVREEDILSTSTGAAWRATPNLTVELAHDWTQRETNLVGGDYTANQVTLSVSGAF